MNTTKLEQFLLLAETQNMSRAAELLYISQSALSQSLDSLEKELGCRLFDRERKRIILNQNGEFLLPYARDIVEKNEEMLSALNGFLNSQSTLSIGAPIYASFILLSSAYNLYDSSVHMNFVRCSEEESVTLLKDHSIDLAFVENTIEDPDIISTVLLHDRSLILLPEDSPLCGRREISLQDIKGVSFYRNRDLLKDNSIFYNGGNDRVLSERLKANDIKIDYADFLTMRLLWNSTDHFFFISTTSLYICPELMSLPRTRFVTFSEQEPISRYICHLRRPSQNMEQFLKWLHTDRNSLSERFIRISHWLDGIL